MSLKIGGTTIAPGSRQSLSLSLGKLYDSTALPMPVHVICSKDPGPTLLLSAAIHGDEINGTEIIQRLLKHPSLRKIRGTLIAVPIVNVFGFNNRSRYFPDRRDLNRSFPGSKKGALASRVAALFVDELLSKADYCLDFHTAALYRSNLPQVRADMNNQKNLELAEAFNVPVMLHSELRDGSLRQMTTDLGIPTLVFEGGEALRFDPKVTRLGLLGTLEVMRKIGMIASKEGHKKKRRPSFFAQSNRWERAPQSGILRSHARLGASVEKGEILGYLLDPIGENMTEINASVTGLIVGKTVLPLINQGDALFNLALVEEGAEEPAWDHLEKLYHESFEELSSDGL